jgi:exosortase
MKTRKLLAIIALVAAFLPVLNWYWLRLGNGSGEPFGLIALTLAVGLAFQNRHTPSLRLAEIAIIIYAIGIFFLPPLLRTIPALATIAFLTGMHRQAGQFGLLLLSLPMQASLDFFLGYPFRLITAEGARLFVNLLGYPVERLGVQLSLKGIIVSVDPPCSGLQMLWATALLAALLAGLFRLSYLRTFQLSLLALALCLLANILRAAALFFPESGMITLPGFAHQGIGLIFFALAGITLASVARKFHRRTHPPKLPQKQISPRFLALACGVSLITLLPARNQSSATPENLDTLASYQGHAVEEISLSPREEAFAQNFPGQLKIYAVGRDTLIIRRINRASRMLHPSYHCLKAEGFAISDASIQTDEQGRQFLSYNATRNQEGFLVTERIRDLENHQQWTEVSAWYWHALFHPNSGPWEAETLMTPLQKNHE